MACQNAGGPVAQWLEQATHNRSVVGSIPARPTSYMLVAASGVSPGEVEVDSQRAVVTERSFGADADLRPVGLQSVFFRRKRNRCTSVPCLGRLRPL